MTQPIEQEQASSTKRILIIVGVIIVIILSLFILTTLTANPDARKERLMNSQSGKIESATASSLKAEINLYRVQEGRYPWSYERLKEVLSETRTIDHDKYLTDLKYTLRGDGEAYRFTYTSITGETVTVEGNYSEEYH